ncbi:unnamed protein product [Rotaria sp. Silwood2]|nr:unnamed protein product [Rotaria sp. Silwood2]CAF3170578.1 unnamed protein product [Rotaria sp. Silwood2]CAF3381173.1 unnamed protein product [Rotaria sp. Silwood2]CAF4664321.1 unnamed protein product [Rotaria sp. Silwood2]
MTYNVDILEIDELDGILTHAILSNIVDLGTLINRQIKSFQINDRTISLHNAQHFCTLLSNLQFNLKKVSFCVYDSFHVSNRGTSHLLDAKHRCTEYIVNLIRLLVDHLQQLVSLLINFDYWFSSKSSCFPHLMRRQLHERPLSRPYRLRFSRGIQIWL